MAMAVTMAMRLTAMIMMMATMVIMMLTSMMVTSMMVTAMVIYLASTLVIASLPLSRPAHIWDISALFT